MRDLLAPEELACRSQHRAGVRGWIVSAGSGERELLALVAAHEQEAAPERAAGRMAAGSPGW